MCTYCWHPVLPLWRYYGTTKIRNNFAKMFDCAAPQLFECSPLWIVGELTALLRCHALSCPGLACQAATASAAWASRFVRFVCLSFARYRRAAVAVSVAVAGLSLRRSVGCCVSSFSHIHFALCLSAQRTYDVSERQTEQQKQKQKQIQILITITANPNAQRHKRKRSIICITEVH